MLDDPLWVVMALLKAKTSTVLIPLLLDDPLCAERKAEQELFMAVLIPLLLDDPLWASKAIHAALKNNGLNPSFAG